MHGSCTAHVTLYYDVWQAVAPAKRPPLSLHLQRIACSLTGVSAQVCLCALQKAEVVNGRIAMIAFALLIAVETWKAGPGLVP